MKIKKILIMWIILVASIFFGNLKCLADSENEEFITSDFKIMSYVSGGGKNEYGINDESGEEQKIQNIDAEKYDLPSNLYYYNDDIRLRIRYEKNAKEKLPKEFYTDVTYGNSIKALSIHLGCYNVIAYNRLSDFFNVISNNVLNISTETLVNFIKELSIKSKGTIENLENNFLNGTTG